MALIKVYVRDQDLTEFLAALNDSEDWNLSYRMHTRHPHENVEVFLTPAEFDSIALRLRKGSDEEG